MQSPPPSRETWDALPDVLLHAVVTAVKRHPAYAAAKSGDGLAALRLVQDTISADVVRAMRGWAPNDVPVLSPVHALEDAGVNAIPIALAEELATRLGWRVETSIVQANVVGHTGASGFRRLARQAVFTGEVSPDASYVLVDDFIGQGGTLANLRGHILRLGARVLGATVLTGKLHSTKLSLSDATLTSLRSKHGPELEAWWEARFGHAFDCLTESEARYLLRTEDAQRVRDRVAQEEQG